MLCLLNIVSSGGGGHYPHDVTTQYGLTSIYNERVVKAENMHRPLSSSDTAKLGFHHEGMRWAHVVLLYVL